MAVYAQCDTGKADVILLTRETQMTSSRPTGQSISPRGQDQFATIQKRDNEQIRLEIRQYRGSTFVDLRLYYCNEADPEYKPTKKGITINPEQYTEFLGHLIRIGYDLGVLSEVEKGNGNGAIDALGTPQELLTEIDRMIREG